MLIIPVQFEYVSLRSSLQILIVKFQSQSTIFIKVVTAMSHIYLNSNF
jgi:hypothetical protein